MASDDSDAMFYIENGYSYENMGPEYINFPRSNGFIIHPTCYSYDDYDDDYEDSRHGEKGMIVFIDAENISPKEYESKYKKKIKKFAKNRGIDFDEIEVRAYAVDDGPAGSTWKSDGVSMKRIPGKPARDKSDKQIAKEMEDQLGTGKMRLLVTHDKKLQSKVNKSSNRVYIFDE